jgi:hypothetical protein
MFTQKINPKIAKLLHIIVSTIVVANHDQHGSHKKTFLIILLCMGPHTGLWD